MFTSTIVWRVVSQTALGGGQLEHSDSERLGTIPEVNHCAV
jgi:hypothetical protein